MNAQTFANKLFSLLLIIVTLFSLTSVSSIAKESGEELIPDSPATNNSELAHDNSDNAKKDPLPKHEISKASTDSIQSGVYAISQQNTKTYARCYTVEGGTYMSRQTFSSPPASEAQRHAMFKIIYRSTTDDYVIRSLVNSEVIIYCSIADYGPISAKMEGANDSDIPPERAWKITATADGFYNISRTSNGTTYYMYMPESGSLRLTTDKNLSGSKWSFSKYTGPIIRGWGKIGEWPDHIVNGTSATITAYIYSTVIGENRAWFRPSSVNPDVATANRLSYTAQMTITPKYGGNTKIQIEANVGSAIFGYDYLLSGWDTGSFLIKNAYTSEFLTELGGVTDSELRLTGLPNGNDKEYTSWNMYHYSGGYYKIVQDIVGDCIYGPHSATSNIKGKDYNIWQETLWKFVPQSNGTLKIQSQYNANNNPDNYMSLDNTTTKNIRSLATTGSKQSWYITPIKFNVNILYDEAFIDKHASVGHDTVLNHVFGNNSANTSIQKALFDQLGIRFTINITSTTNNPFSSYPYEQGCLKCSYRDALCENHSQNSNSYTCNTTGQSTLSGDCANGLHHKRWNIFSRNLSSSSTFVPILFTGHKGCEVSNGKHVSANVAGYAVGSRIVILSQGGVASTGNESARLLMHEITHILGVRDNVQEYTNESSPDYDPTQEYRMNCIMGFNRRSSTIQENLTICSYCQNVAKQHKYSFYQH